MARRELGQAALRVAHAVHAVLPEAAVVGCSGGADSLALALGAQWAARQRGSSVRAVVVDHGLQAGSSEVAVRVASLLDDRGIAAEVVRVTVDGSDGGLEAAAREARLGALTAAGLPVLLGHTLDDQAETVLLGLLRGSGTRSLSGMAASTSFAAAPSAPGGDARAVTLLRPLLGLRRADTEAACRDWDVTPWEDPMNDDPRFARVAFRQHLTELRRAVGRDLAPSLARTAQLARADADLLDELAARAVPVDGDLTVDDLAPLPDALRWRVLHRWLARVSPTVEFQHVLAVDALVTDWRGQGALAVPGGQVLRVGHLLTVR
ncbi:tRNA lysidine(34) synthetase TilS [Tessaracoccus sp. Y36]